MWRAAGVRRDAAGLNEAQESVDHWCGYVLNRQFNDPAGWQLQNMLWVARLMIAAAAMREESRGVHLRVDFPQLDNAHWQKHLAFVRGC
jgi:L-aspartate oxidase